MEKRYLTPKEVAQATIKSGIAKANLKLCHMLILGIFAGMFIAFGAYGDIVIMQTLKNIDVGLMKFFGALVFPIGLMLVVMAGAELFTGNNLMTLAFMDKKITLKQLMTNWIVVYIGNFIGSLFLVFVLFKANLFSESATTLSVNIAKAKISLPFGVLFLRAILCNIIVVLAVWMATAAQDIVSKIFACWFPIMLFVLSGYEHSVANMFFIPMGKALGLSVSWIDIFTVNLIPVTLGNIVGGGLIVPIAYYICYVKNNKEKVKNI
ncbi:formate/nitrite transporter family protein [Tepidibacter hydrothermalis]|uniref:Formate/nitrite transporter family protein n=1 Tax=Tepidibacter hydrothermalis TaxID=3036126 RepID=A0ABY8ED05_9FIRM|nr:formate/nitrite transporter family protein [Tepidibacter hydrothermalis]WFD10820.1 formate/nitrite transporter family protein [Tepidibacter hydrothermalis]